MTRENQHVFGTVNNTYTLPGITSGASAAAQGPVHGLVTTDANGNLASDGGALQRRVDRNAGNIDENREGVAVAMTLDAPYINWQQSFAVGGNWANFEDENALGFMVAGRVTKFGDTGTFDLAGGVGFGLEQDSVGGRLGGQLAW